MAGPSLAQARDAIQTLFLDAWNANAATVAGTDAPPPVYWDNMESAADEPPPRGEPWARVSVQHNLGEQSTMGAPGGRNFERYGLVMIQVFVPRGTGLVISDALCKIARDAFEGARTPDGEVWFRNATVREVGAGRDTLWFQTNVSAEFNYTELR